MKIQMMSAFVVMSLTVSCGQQNDASSTLEAAEAGTVYIAVVKQVAQTSACAKRVAAIAGVTLKGVLPAVGAISFNASRSGSDKVAMLSCISSVEKEATADASAPRAKSTLYNAVIKDAPDIAAATTQCAQKMMSIPGVVITQVLNALGVVSFNANVSASQRVQALSCVLSVEKDEEVHGNPSTRIGN